MREETWPAIESADEMHDALVVFGFLTAAEIAAHDPGEAGVALGPLLERLALDRRATAIDVPGAGVLHAAAERLHELIAVLPAGAAQAPALEADRRRRAGRRRRAARDSSAAGSSCSGPVTELGVAASLGIGVPAVRSALFALESEGAAMQGNFTAPDATEWCERRLLARMYKYSRDRRRAGTRPVPVAQFLRFLFRWQRIAGEDGRREGEEGLLAALRQLEGCVAPAAAWEDDLLPARVQRYLPVDARPAVRHRSRRLASPRAGRR